jgi:hypothetical protein
MKTESTLVNRVEKSGLLTLDLEEYWSKQPVTVFDLKPYLVKELVLMEKPFRETLQNINWNDYKGKAVTVTCSADALIPMWAYMLVASKLQPVAKQVLFGTIKEAQEKILLENISSIDVKQFEGAKVVVKGCGKNPVPAEAYLLASNLLLPVVKSLMFGEACSTVPVYKKSQSDE